MSIGTFALDNFKREPSEPVAVVVVDAIKIYDDPACFIRFQLSFSYCPWLPFRPSAKKRSKPSEELLRRLVQRRDFRYIYGYETIYDNVRCFVLSPVYFHIPAVVKPTKTNRLVLRCDNCGMLHFANGEDAQEILSGLPYHNDPESYNYYSSGY
jgi:hypothetical protein